MFLESDQSTAQGSFFNFGQFYVPVVGFYFMKTDFFFFLLYEENSFLEQFYPDFKS